MFCFAFHLFYFIIIIIVMHLGHSKAALRMCSIIKGPKSSVFRTKGSLLESELVGVQRSDPQTTAGCVNIPEVYMTWSVKPYGVPYTQGKIRVSCFNGGT